MRDTITTAKRKENGKYCVNFRLEAIMDIAGISVSIVQWQVVVWGS